MTSSRLASLRLTSCFLGSDVSLLAKSRMVSTSRKSCSACAGVILVSALPACASDFEFGWDAPPSCSDGFWSLLCWDDDDEGGCCCALCVAFALVSDKASARGRKTRRRCAPQARDILQQYWALKE